MSIQIDIPDNLFKRLQKHAIPFVDLTPVSVIERWADHFEANSIGGSKGEFSESNHTENSAGEFNPLQPPDLLHTRARGSLGSNAFLNWNELVRIAHIVAFDKAKTFEELRTATHAQIKKGNFSGGGYRYLPEIDVSVQGVDANRAWQYSLRLAKYLQIPLRVSIEWRQNEKAAYPGKNALLFWNP